jgi:hypothetical protein
MNLPPRPISSLPQEALVPPGVTRRTAVLTPEAAQRLLDRNKRNRTMNLATVEMYARDMKAGRWVYTGDPLQISRTGVLLNGQHRVAAVVVAQEAQTFDFVEGLPDEAQRYMDLGKQRTVSDINKISGRAPIAGISAVVSIARMLMAMDGATRPSKPELDAYIQDRSEALQDAGRFAKNMHQAGFGGGSGLWGTAYYLCAQQDADDAHLFWNDVLEGAGLSQSDPAYLLRARVMKDRPRPARDFPRVRHPLALCLLAWNYYRDNRHNLERLKWDENRDPFPVAK